MWSDLIAPMQASFLQISGQIAFCLVGNYFLDGKGLSWRWFDMQSVLKSDILPVLEWIDRNKYLYENRLLQAKTNEN